jgi:fructokinase
VDSVGAGDAFTAALVIGLLHSRGLDEINEHANRVAAFVCEQHGATPDLPDELSQF